MSDIGDYPDDGDASVSWDPAVVDFS